MAVAACCGLLWLVVTCCSCCCRDGGGLVLGGRGGGRCGCGCGDQLWDASAQRNLDATNTSCLSDNSSLAPLCREHPSDGTDQSTTGKCSDDGRGLVKNLSGRLARKLQRRASLVNAGLSKQIQSVLDAAVVDRCDFVEICCSDGSDRSHPTTWDLFVFSVALRRRRKPRRTDT